MREAINPVLNQNSGSSIEQTTTKSHQFNTAGGKKPNLNMTMPIGAIKANILDTTTTIEPPSTKKQRDLSLVDPPHSRLSELTKSNIP